jgi:hypothetical protein
MFDKLYAVRMVPVARLTLRDQLRHSAERCNSWASSTTAVDSTHMSMWRLRLFGYGSGCELAAGSSARSALAVGEQRAQRAGCCYACTNALD